MTTQNGEEETRLPFRPINAHIIEIEGIPLKKVEKKDEQVCRLTYQAGEVDANCSLKRIDIDTITIDGVPNKNQKAIVKYKCELVT